jgi:serine/threonine protein kinase/Tfp pilus assembly protein PilF
MPTAQEIEFGQLVVEHQLATTEQVRECFAVQTQLPSQKHIGTILIERGYLQQQHAQRLFELQKQRSNIKPPPPSAAHNPSPDTILGQQLLQYRLIAQPQLTEVFHEVQRLRTSGHNISLAQRLLQRGLFQPKQLAALQQANPSSGVHQSFAQSGSGSHSFAAPGSGDHSFQAASGSGSHSFAAPGSGNHSFQAGSGSDDFIPSVPHGYPPQTVGSGFQSSPQIQPPVGGAHFANSSTNASGSGLVSPPTKQNSRKATQFKDNDPMARKLPHIAKPDGVYVLDFGTYEILDEVARGGMGIVYKAFHKKEQRIVALKAMKRGENASEKQVRRFKQETEAANKLDHPHVVGVHDMGCYEGFHFYTMDLVAGGALDTRIKRGDMPGIRESANIVREVAEAIEHAHSKKIIHRDLKPANILFDGENRAKVTDFGLAKNVDRKSMLTRTGAVVGTPYYMPPEQARGNTDIDVRCDVYALGVILYELMTGKPPFRGETAMEIYQKILEEEPTPPTQKNKKIPKELEIICLKAIAKNREKRYQSSQALADDIERYLKGQAIKGRPPGLIEKINEIAAKHKSLFLIILAVVLALLILACGLSYMFIRNSRHSHFVAASKSWNEATNALSDTLNKARRSLEEARNRMDDNPKISKEELDSAQNQLFSLNEMLNEKAKVNKKARLALLQLCLDPELRNKIITDETASEKPEISAFLKLARTRQVLYKLPENDTFNELDEDDVQDFLNFVRASSVDANPSAETLKDYRVQNPFLKRNLPALFRDLHLEEGRLAAKAGQNQNFEQATQAFNKALKYAFKPNETQEIRLEIARTFAKQQKVDLAIDTYNSILKEKNKGKFFAIAAYERGQLYTKKGSIDLAIKDFTRAIENSFKPAAEHLARGRLYMKKGLFNQALADFTKLLSFQGNSFEGYLERGRAYAALEKFDDAEGSFTEAIEKQSHPDAYFQRGLIYTRQKKYLSALLNLSQAINKASSFFSNKKDLNQSLAQYYRTRADIHTALGESAKGKSDLTKAAQYSKRK